MCEVKKIEGKQGRTFQEERTVFTKAQTCECVERLPSLDHLMCVEKWKEMRWEGRKSHILKDLACPAMELNSVLRNLEAVKEL